MDDAMIRFITFLVVIFGLGVYFYWTSRPRVFEPSLKAKRKRQPPAAAPGEFWVQVYDTDSADEARRIQARFHDLGIQCFLYEQGRKDVYGNVMKHYGISVPRRVLEKAQSVLSEITP
jgi:hypothetical protein